MSLITNIISYWRLDEASGDASDSVASNTLTNVNTAVYSPGLINHGVDFGSSNTNKRLGILNDLGITGGACSWSAFVNITTAPTSGNIGVIVHQEDGGTSVFNSIFYENASGTLRLGFIRGRRTGPEQGILYNVTLTPGTWYHVGYTYDGTNVIAYLNAVQVGSTTPASGTGTGGADATGIGCFISDPTNNRFLSGLVDEVGIWSRALSGSEITQIYNSGGGFRYPFSGTIQPNNSARGITTSTGPLPYNLEVRPGAVHIGVDHYGFTRDGDFGNGLTLAGVPATLVQKQNTRNSRWEYHYRSIGVSIGTNAVVFNTTGTPGRTECFSVALGQVAQSTTPDATAFITASTANPFVASITTVANNAWITMGVDVGASGSDGAGATLLQDNIASGGAMQLYDNSKVAPKTPAGSATLNVLNPSAGINIALMASWAPFTSTDYPASLSSGSYALTGRTITVNRTLHAVLSAGSYALTGVAITASKIHLYTASLATGMYNLAGQSVGINKILHAILSAGSYVLTGVSINASKIHLFVANLASGMYNLTGKSISVLAPMRTIWKLFSPTITFWKGKNRGQ